MEDLKSYIRGTGLSEKQHVFVHTAFRAVRGAFPGTDIKQFIQTIKDIVTPDGSLIMPGFSYCFKKSDNSNEIFRKDKTKSKVGAVSETFRMMPGTIRTASPTHSFLLWGKITEHIPDTNNPVSPLGRGSVLEWLEKHENTSVMLMGTDFASLTFGHYLECAAGLPWLEFSPWGHLNVEPFGVSETGTIKLKEVPGCSKSFKSFQQFLENHSLIQHYTYNGLESFLISVQLLFEKGLLYFKSNPEKILCPIGTCVPCDARWDYFLKKLKSI